MAKIGLKLALFFVVIDALFSGSANADGFGEGASPTYVADFLATSEGLALTRAFTRITDAKLRRSIVDLVEQIAAREGPDKR